MASPELDRERELFFASLQLPEPERRAYLDRTCGDDGPLRQRLESLLQAHAKATSEFASLAVSPADIPAKIDGYRVLRVIGAGGMGTVYEAEQLEPLRRRVALKVIRPFVHPGEAPNHTASRFAAELEMLAAMDHPNVARVFDAGTTHHGQAYFAMELVNGAPINDYCEQHRLDVRARIRPFLQLCRAVEHAHQKGIIHRDLKPANILVGGGDAEAFVKVIDFGIAKAIGRDPLMARLTMTGAPVGTPAYMSPEQAGTGIDIDTRSDIYSLGVILYELASGVLPADPGAYGFALFISRLGSGDLSIPAPSTKAAPDLAREIRGDLDWIVLRALNPDRSRRYQSASALADDLECLLGNRPVSARSPTLGYRMSTFVRRNRVQAGAAGVAVLALIGGSVAAGLNYARALHAESVARQEAVAASEVSNFLINTFKVNDPGESRGRTVTARELLENASIQVDKSFASQPGIRQRLLTSLSQAYASLGLHENAERLSRSALASLPAAGRETLQDAAALLAYSKACHVLNRFDEAGDTAARAAAIRTRILGRRHPDVADALYQEAHVLASVDKFDTAIDRTNEVLSIRLEALGEQHVETGRALLELGYINARQRRPGYRARAQDFYKRSLAIFDATHGQDHPEYARNLEYLANMLESGEAALPLLKQALAIRRRIMGANHITVATSLEAIGRAYIRMGKFAQAKPHLLEALRIREAALGPDSMQTGVVLHSLALAERPQCRRASAFILRTFARDLRQNAGAGKHAHADDTNEHRQDPGVSPPV